jgi:hypothetical protein
MYGACITIVDFEHICRELSKLTHRQTAAEAIVGRPAAANRLQGKPTIEPLDVFRAPWVQKSEARRPKRNPFRSHFRVTITFGSVALPDTFE